MSTVRPGAPSPSPPAPGASSVWRSRLRLSKTAWWLIGGGFAFGVLLFVLLWLDMRDNGNFYRAQPVGEAVPGQVFEPLPTPQGSDDGRSASGLSEAAREIAANPRPAPAPVTPPPRPAEPETPPSRSSTQPSNTPLAAGSVPQPIERVAPKYPAEAARRNETGTVIVRVEVGTDGTPEEVTIARSSRSRALDRAALQAVRQWRFRPAQRDGQAVVASLDIPFDFTLQER